VRIEDFRPEHAARFEALNRAWLVEHELIEAADEPQLTQPVETIIDPGGAILVALDGDEVIGTCAIMPHGADEFELVKLAVTPSARGRGIGRQLIEACLKLARQRGARRVDLLSSSKLGGAVRLYERAGFRHAPLPPHNPYTTADVYMVFDFDSAHT
jgi:ribosomal protein S18 acetylase RimI-like enzyme